MSCHVPCKRGVTVKGGQYSSEYKAVDVFDGRNVHIRLGRPDVGRPTLLDAIVDYRDVLMPHFFPRYQCACISQFGRLRANQESV